MLKRKKYKAIIKIKNKFYDTFIIDGKNKKSVKKFLVNFYYRIGVISDIDEFDCELVKVEFNGKDYVEME